MSTALTPTHTLVGQPLLPTGSTLSAGALPSTLPLTQPPPLLQHLPIQTSLTLSNPSRPGLILSPACDPIPQSIVQRVQSGQFIEMRDLLADNIALMGQLSSLHGTLPLPPTTIQRTWLREVPSLASWMYCFAAYIAIHEALRHGGTGWAEYDRVFQRQVSINPVLSWNMLEPSLQAATILGQRTSDGILCTICQECDHTNNQCAMAPFQQQLQPLPPVVMPAAP